MKRQKITPYLWYDKEAKEAAKLYVSTFANSKIRNTSTFEGSPSGSVDVVTVELAGSDFELMSAGPYFKFNPSVSFLVACESKAEVDEAWAKLANDGTALMELGAYPFSEWYGWCQDRYGLSWQIMYFGGAGMPRDSAQKVTPTLMFVGSVCGKAEEAIRLYASLFEDSKVGEITRYGAGESPDKPGTVKHAGFTLHGQAFAAMDSAHEHDFAFNEAISFMVTCADQKEIDYYWKALSAVPESEQCGWLKDRYGVSWQIVPAVLDDMLASKDQKQVARVTEAFLQMRKFDLAALERAYEGK